MQSPSLLYFVGIGIRALGCALLGCVAGFITLVMSGEHRVGSNCDPTLVCFFGALTGAVVSIAFSAVRLWQIRLAVAELRGR